MSAKPETKTDLREAPLYELTGAVGTISRALEDVINNTEMAEDLRNSEIDRLMADLELAQEALPAKIENCIRYIRGKRALADARRAEAARLDALADQADREADAMQNGYVARCMENLTPDEKGRRVVKTLLGNVSLSITEHGRLEIIDESELPPDPVYWKPQAPKFDLAGFKEDVKAGKFGELLGRAVRWIPSKRLRLP